MPIQLSRMTTTLFTNSWPHASALLGLLLSALPYSAATAQSMTVNVPILPLSSAQRQQARIQTQAPGTMVGGSTGWLVQGQAVLPPQAQRTIAAPVAGILQSVNLQPMQLVRAGQAVAVVYSPDLLQWQRELAEADNEMALARQTLQREQQLYREGIIAEKRVIEARSAVQRIELRQQEKRRLLAMAGKGTGRRGFDPVLNVRSQVSGQVNELMASPGQRVEAGTPIASLIRADQLRIQLFASAAQAAQIQAGDTVQVAGCPQYGRVASNTGWLDPKTQSRIIWVDMAGALTCLKPQQFLQAQILPAEKPSTLMSLPASALIRQQNGTYVFVAHPRGFVPVPVHVQQQSSGVVQVWPFSVGGVRDLQVAVSGIAQLKAIWQGIGEEQRPATAAPTGQSAP